MPIKYTKKRYLSGGIYHIYNRGIDGKQVFVEASDYERYIKEMKKYLENDNEEKPTIFKNERPYRKRYKQSMKLIGEVEVLAYCLMPEHMHLLVKQYQVDAMTKLMRRVNTGYVMYYNEKYKRRGPLFEGVYKGVLVNTAEDAVYISRMIHLNPVLATIHRFGPVEAVMGTNPGEYMYSSCRNYFNKEQYGWVNTEPLFEEYGKLSAGKWKSYRDFVSDNRISQEQGWRGAALD